MNQQHVQGHNSVNSSLYRLRIPRDSRGPLGLRANGSNLRIGAKIFIFVLVKHSESSSSCVSPEPFVSCRRTEGTRATLVVFLPRRQNRGNSYLCVSKRKRFSELKTKLKYWNFIVSKIIFQSNPKLL